MSVVIPFASIYMIQKRIHCIQLKKLCRYLPESPSNLISIAGFDSLIESFSNSKNKNYLDDLIQEESVKFNATLIPSSLFKLQRNTISYRCYPL